MAIDITGQNSQDPTLDGSEIIRKGKLIFPLLKLFWLLPLLFYLPLSTCFRPKGQARASATLTTLCVPYGSPGALLGTKSFCHPLQPLHTQPQGKSHIPSTAQWAEDQKPLWLTQRGAPTSPRSCFGPRECSVPHKQITCVFLTGSLRAGSYLRHGTWGGSGGTGAGGEAAAASDPEDCEEAKYGQLPEQMLSLLGNRGLLEKPGSKEVQEGTNDARPPGEPLAVDRELQVTHSYSCSVITTLMRLSVDTEPRASGIL